MQTLNQERRRGAVDEREPVYAIAVVARLTGMHPQTLRKYERVGLLRPARQGGQRQYSNADVRRLRRIQFLVEERGLNVAGLELTLSVADRLDDIGQDASLEDLRTAIADVLRLTS